MTFNPHPHERTDEPIGQRAHNKLAAFGEMMDTMEAVHLSALAAGAVSPLADHAAQLAAIRATDPKARADAAHAAARAAEIARITAAEAELAEALGQVYENPTEETVDATRSAEEMGAASRELASIVFREGEFVRHSRNRAGEVITAEAWEEAQKRRRLMDEQTRELALSLTSAGVRAFLPSDAPRAYLVDPISEQAIPILPTRRINFLPNHAAAARAPRIKELEAFLERHPFTKMPTFTAGKRVFLDEPGAIRAAVSDLSRRLSRLNHSKLFARANASFAFRAIELGELKRTECRFPRVETGLAALAHDLGRVTVHPHAHTFLAFERPLTWADFRPNAEDVAAAIPGWGFVPPRPGRIGPELPLFGPAIPPPYSVFIRRVWEWWGAVWDAGRTVEEAREACKYPVKPADIAAARLTNEEVAALYRELSGLHLVQMLGELKKTARRHKENGYKGRRWRREGGPLDGSLALRFRPDWNGRRRDLKAQANRAALRAKERREGAAWYFCAFQIIALADRLAAAPFLRQKAPGAVIEARWRRLCRQADLYRVAYFLATVTPRPAAETHLWGLARIKAAEKAAHPAAPMVNRIVARMPAAAYFDRVARPALYVWGFNQDFAALRREKIVADYAAAIAPKLSAAAAELAAEVEAVAVETTEALCAEFCARS